MPEVGLKVSERVAGELQLISRHSGGRYESLHRVVVGRAGDGDHGNTLDAGGRSDGPGRLTGGGEQAVEQAGLVRRPGGNDEGVARPKSDAVIGW